MWLFLLCRRVIIFAGDTNGKLDYQTDGFQTKNLRLFCHLKHFNKFLTNVQFRKSSEFNSFQLSVAFHIETSHLACKANEVSGFYMKCNTRLKWVNIHLQKKFSTRIRCVIPSQRAFTCSKLTIKTVEQGGKYVQS